MAAPSRLHGRDPAGVGPTASEGCEPAVLDPPRLRWDRSLVPGENDDVPPRARGAVRPPPSLLPEDAPDSVAVPRMEPPPPSLEAMVENRGRRLKRKRPEPTASSPRIWVVVALALATAALTAYLMR